MINEKTNHTLGESIYKSTYLTKGLSKCIKNSHNSVLSQQTNFLNQAQKFNSLFTKEYIQMVNKLTKADSTLVIRKMQIQTTTRYRTTHPFRRVRRRKNLTTPRADEDTEPTGILVHC